MRMVLRALGAVACLCCLSACTGSAGPTGADAPGAERRDGAVNGWLAWRGPGFSGVSEETGLPDRWALNGVNHLWSVAISGRGTPVVAGNRLYAWGYRGDEAELREVLVCLDSETGRLLWEDRQSDFLSDIVYDRYSIGAPAVDPRTGHVFWMTSAGLLSAYAPDGRVLWRRSLMEEFGKLTFPNGRTGAPVVDDDLVIVHGITANWGGDGPGRDRFYAFDTDSGDLVWASTPGETPKDSSFSTPVPAWENGRRVLYCGTGCGHLVALDARTGQPLWRYRMSGGGVNVTVAVHQGKLIALHEDENVDSADKGRMIAVRIPGDLGGALPKVLDRGAEVWRNSQLVLSSSPVLVGDVVYQVNKAGELLAVDAPTGAIRWQMKLGGDQLHASPTYADGKLYVPMWHDGLYIIRPGARGGEVLSHQRFPEGEECLGAPAVWNGRVYLLTTRGLYCFGRRGAGAGPPAMPWPTPHRSSPGAPAALQILPAEVALQAGREVPLRVRAVDARGQVAPWDGAAALKWTRYVPPAARVRSEMDAAVDPPATLRAAAQARESAGAWEAAAGPLRGYLRGRVLPSLPYQQDFEGFDLAAAHATEKTDAGAPIRFAYPPLPWIGARFKWEVRDVGGNKALAKTLDNIFFQRAMTFVGHPGMSDYTLEADVMAEGTRRNMSDVGLINQRYIVALLGNWQQLQVVSNQDRLNVTVPFHVERGTWYRMKTRVDLAADGSGVVRARVWKRGAPEPDGWTIEAPHRLAHRQGAAGIYGFALQAQHRVYVDNLTIRPND